MKKMVLAVCYMLAYVVQVASAEFFVSTNGDDNAAGTAGAPFKTLAKAKAAVRQLIPSASGPINVWIHSGTYYLDSTLKFTPEDGGSASVPITYSAYRGEKVVISGGIKVSSQWTTSSGNIMVTTIGTNLKVDQLFLNGKRQILARYPNYDSTQILQGNATDALAKAAQATNPAEGPGYIRAIESRLWGGLDYIITGKNGSTVTYTSVNDNNRGGQMGNRMVENIFELLDAPGEWFYRKSTGQLFFYPPAGTNLNTATIELASLEELFRVVGTASTKVKYLTFNRLTFTQTYRTLFTGKFEGLLRGDWCVVRAGTVFMQDAENITVKNCFFDQVGGNGVFMNAYNRNNRIYNNEFIDAGATCVQTVGLQSAVRTPSTWSNTVNPIADNTPGPLTEDYPKNIVIENNLMKNLGVFEKQTSGVNISMSSKVTVRHNTITKSPRSGININDGTWGGHNIEYNNVDDCVRETGDHGPFNSWGRDRFWGSSPINTTTAALDAMEPTQIHNNRFVGINKDGWHSIDLDDGSSYYTIYNNIMFEAGLKLREGFRRKAYNNIIVVGRIGCHAWYGGSTDSIFSNIVVPSPDFTTNGNQNAYDVQAMSMSSGNKCYIDKNLFWNKNGGGVDYSPTKNAGYDQNSKVADPKFINAAAGDYRVADGSPALALGFVNFPMDSFGRMNVVPDTMEPFNVAITAVQPKDANNVHWMTHSNGFTIRYDLVNRAKVSIELYSVNGKKIATIADSWENPGMHDLIVNTEKLHSLRLAQTMYIVKLVVGKYRETRSMLLADK